MYRFDPALFCSAAPCERIGWDESTESCCVVVFRSAGADDDTPDIVIVVVRYKPVKLLIDKRHTSRSNPSTINVLRKMSIPPGPIRVCTSDRWCSFFGFGFLILIFDFLGMGKWREKRHLSI